MHTIYIVKPWPLMINLVVWLNAHKFCGSNILHNDRICMLKLKTRRKKTRTTISSM